MNHILPDVGLRTPAIMCNGCLQ